MSARGDASSPIGGLACASQRAPMMMVAVSVPHHLQTGGGIWGNWRIEGACRGSRQVRGASWRRSACHPKAVSTCHARAEAGWLGERSNEAGGASSVEQAGLQRFGTRRRLGRRGPEAKSSMTCTAFLVLFWSGVRCGPAESVVLCAWNRAERAPLTLRCAWPVVSRALSCESCVDCGAQKCGL